MEPQDTAMVQSFRLGVIVLVVGVIVLVVGVIVRGVGVRGVGVRGVGVRGVGVLGVGVRGVGVGGVGVGGVCVSGVSVPVFGVLGVGGQSSEGGPEQQHSQSQDPLGRVITMPVVGS